MMKRSGFGLPVTVQLVAAISVLTACSGDALENHAVQSSVYPSAAVSTDAHVPADVLAGMAFSTMVEMQHFDAYEHYRDLFDLHAQAGSSGDTQAAGDSLNGNDDAGHSFLSCFRSSGLK